MMANKIKVLIANDVTVSDSIIKLFENNTEIMVAGQASTSEEVIKQVKDLRPEIVLMGLHMPDRDGFATTEILACESPFPSVILMGPSSGQEDLRRAMIAGAKDYLVMPFTGEDLLSAIKKVSAARQRLLGDKVTTDGGKVLAVFSTKGGVGKTILTINLALALATKYNHKVAIVDLDLLFGDVALCLDISPKASIADMVTDIEHLDDKILSRYMVSFNEYLDILPAPFQPEQAEKISGEHVSIILKLLKKQYQYIVIDTGDVFNDIALSIIDLTDLVFLISSMDLPNIKNMKSYLATMGRLGYAKEKIKLVMNRANSGFGLNIKEMEDSLGCRFVAALPSDSSVVVPSINKGVPFIAGHPYSAISKEIFDLARKIENNELETPEESIIDSERGIFSKFKKLFNKTEAYLP